MLKSIQLLSTKGVSEITADEATLYTTLEKVIEALINNKNCIIDDGMVENYVLKFNFM